MKRDMAPCTMRLPASVDDALRGVAGSAGLTPSEVVALALSRYFIRHGLDPRIVQPGTQPSVLEVEKGVIT